jgi:hypothetical protein
MEGMARMLPGLSIGVRHLHGRWMDVKRMARSSLPSHSLHIFMDVNYGATLHCTVATYLVNRKFNRATCKAQWLA